MKRAHYLIISLLLCGACRSTDQALEKELTSSLNNNNQFIKVQTGNLFREITNKDNDPRTHWRATVWVPKVTAIQKLSEDLYAYIESVKAKPELQTRQMLNMVLDKVEHYRQAIPSAFLKDSFPYPEMREYVKKDLARLLADLPFAATARMSAFEGEISQTIWDKIENDILLSEHALIRYLDLHIVWYDDSFTRYVPLIHQNFSKLKKGQQLVITAGIGAYSAATTKVTIDAHPFELNAEGYAQYRINAKSSPGKYSIPVRVEYTSPDRVSHYFTKSLEYEIAP